jgi:hypothetical protein
LLLLLLLLLLFCTLFYPGALYVGDDTKKWITKLGIETIDGRKGRLEGCSQLTNLLFGNIAST